ncbi:aldo/keto reductase [Comamonas antarctica]|uniref:Aldo/keto reductase n=1 Tax=Comamonas antarctica TaxID=2743470 RepID=A0A6N1X570_9BURK|nr:aldo/keto reductase [Comamonas antarctica]QKV52976.1 aldo/keto reductase [Comamonas antarctica]
MTASPPPLRALGRSGLQVSPLCFGGNVFGWTADEPTSFSLLDAWLDAGFNFIDTADVYSRWVPGHEGGESERILGKWLARSGRRAQVVLATKVGKDMGNGKVGLRPEYIRQAVEASLQRLQTDYIDLYQSHDDDTGVPFADTLGAYADLMAAGKVRAVGASNYGAARFKEALLASERLGLPRYECLQPLYNLYDRAGFERELAPLCVSQDIGVINFYALAAGFLTGKYRSEADARKSPRGPNTVKTYLNARGLAILQALDTVAERQAVQPGQVALAWQLQRPAITAPIASASTLAQMEQLVQAARLRLSADDLALLNAASAEDGARD